MYQPLSVLVLGLGNKLLGDEGAGVVTVEYLQLRAVQPPNVRFVDGGTLSFTLADELCNTDALIIIDAAELHAAPGTVICHEDQAMDSFLGRVKRSAHEIGLLDLLDMARLMDCVPEPRALVGIQHKLIDWSERVSPEVASAIPKAADITLQLINKWTSRHARTECHPHSSK